MTRLDAYDGLDIAVLLPCYNEAPTIAGVVAGFRRALPAAKIWVFDNNSSDGTLEVAMKAGARVVRERRQGKGNVVRRMFADVDADIYVMADGDGTYDPAQAVALIDKLIEEHADMVVGTRRGVTEDAGRDGHAFGNRMFNGIYGQVFGKDFTDILSGYRAFTRRFVKSFPAVSSGFEIETEMSVHAGQLRMPTAEVELDYGRRPDGSHSKLATFKDGFKILVMIAMLMKETRPAAFFGLLASLFGLISLIIGTPVIAEFIATGLVPRLPTAVAAMGLMVIAFLFTACGLILDSVARGRVEQKRILYLAQPPLKVQ
ncbi:MAG: glycosyltransferase [Ancalomicrobiaceae bacterium]|nr:glycosyltransferase [Ancalomicrobiaceae bacterium]